MIRVIFGPRREEVMGSWKVLHIEEYHDLNLWQGMWHKCERLKMHTASDQRA
jgi:hypothetical protein